MEQPKGRILVVDDHPRNIAILQEILGHYRVATAASGEEALRIAPKFAPDLVLLDIMMPDMDGYETCRRFRANPQIAETKIIMVSAKAMVSERLAGYEAGADDYVIKPFDEDELVAKVRAYLRLKSVEELDRLKTDVLTLLGHETRTPLTTIFGPLELLKGDASLSDEHQQMLQMVEDGARRIHELVERAIHLSSLQAGLTHFDLSRHDLGAIVRESIAQIRATAETAGVELTLEGAGPFEVNCDAEQIQRSVSALLSNAVRHSPRPGRVTISLSARDACATLSVWDQGPGIPEHVLPHVFECFSVSDVSKHTSGQGLSLAIARAVVRSHGGMLSAENRLGGGAVFELQLPLAGATREEATQPAWKGARS
jgi:two-component system, sensor histidine kinase and response regulator